MERQSPRSARAGAGGGQLPELDDSGSGGGGAGGGGGGGGGRRPASRSPPESAHVAHAGGMRSPRAPASELRGDRRRGEREGQRHRHHHHQHHEQQEYAGHHAHHAHGHGHGHSYSQSHSHSHAHSHAYTHSQSQSYAAPPSPRQHTPHSPRRAHTNPHYAHGHPHGHYTPRLGGGPLPTVASPRGSVSMSGGSGGQHGGTPPALGLGLGLGLGLSTGASRTPSPPTPVDDPDWTDGEFVLESTDLMRFRVPSYYLFAASAAFRDAAAAAATETAGVPLPVGGGGDDADPDPDAEADGAAAPRQHYVRFSDAGESAAVIRLFLEFIVYARVEVPDDGTTLDSLRAMRSLVLFLKRYDCLPTLQLYLTCLREAVRQPSNISPLAAFVAGATAGDAFTCSTALDITDWVWRMMDRHNLPASPDANVFDPHHMPVAVWQLIPPMYTWALTTAWTGTEDHMHRHSPHRRGLSDASSSVGELVSRKVHSWQQ